MILYRSKKNIVKNFKVVPYFAGCLIIVLVFCFTGFFGQYNKVPIVSDIDYAYAVASSSDGYLTSNSGGASMPSSYNHDTIIGRITDQEDLNNLVSIHQNVVDSLGDGNGTFKVVYIMKDGSAIVRGYYDVGEQAERETLKIYNTKAYKEQVEFGFTTSEDEINKQLDNLYNQWQINYGKHTAIDGAEHDIQATRYYRFQAMANEDMVFLADKTQINSINLNDTISTAQIRELKACMAQDIASLDVEEYILSGESAVYYLGLTNKEGIYEVADSNSFDVSRLDSLADYEYRDSFPIYPSMTRTIAYINSLNLNLPQLDSDLIKSVKYIDADERYGNTEVLNYYDPVPKDNSFYAYALTKDATDYYEYMYGESYYRYNATEFENGSETTDKALIDQLYSNSKDNYKLIGDNGKIVLFSLSDGSVFTGYVPEEYVPIEIK